MPRKRNALDCLSCTGQKHLHPSWWDTCLIPPHPSVSYVFSNMCWPRMRKVFEHAGGREPYFQLFPCC